MIVATDGTNLLNQWLDELIDWIEENKISFHIWKSYEKHKNSAQYELMPSDSIYLTSRTGNNFYKKTLENLSAKQKAKTLVIHDEIHKLGANSHLENLGGVHDGFYGKLGLSATPERNTMLKELFL